MLDPAWPIPAMAGHAPDRRLGLALSGSGLRAALFQVGVLARLAELDLLREVEVLSCVGGAALTGGLYYLHLQREIEAEGDVASDRLIELVGEVERQLLAFVQSDLHWRCRASLRANWKAASTDEAATEQLARLLDQELFQLVAQRALEQPVRLRDLAIRPRGDAAFNPASDNAGRYCKVPALILHATTLQTGHGWRFEAAQMGEPPPDRRLERGLQLGPARYDRLPAGLADLTLGQAVAAALAEPGQLAPLQLAAADRRVALADGGLADSLGSDALRARGCSHLVISVATGPIESAAVDAAAGLTRRSNALLRARVRELQLAALAAALPERLALIHSQRELAAAAAPGLGLAGETATAPDRAAQELTSYGVQRQVQQHLAGLRADLAGCTEIEACALMADGYLVTGRELADRQAASMLWDVVPCAHPASWQFAAICGVLANPPPALLRQLAARGQRVGRPRRLAWLRRGGRLAAALPHWLLAQVQLWLSRRRLKAGRLASLGLAAPAAPRPLPMPQPAVAVAAEDAERAA